MVAVQIDSVLEMPVPEPLDTGVTKEAPVFDFLCPLLVTATWPIVGSRWWLCPRGASHRSILGDPLRSVAGDRRVPMGSQLVASQRSVLADLV